MEGSERQQVQGFAALRDDVKEIFLRFVDSANDVFWISSLNPERQVYVNEAVERVWGIPRDRFYRNFRVWADLVHEDDAADVLGAYERWINAEPGSPFDITFRITLPNSQVRWVHDRGIWISRDPNGEALVAGIATDVTESKLLEQALQDRENQLRKLIEDRERMSQDLHDDILQSLYSIGLELETHRRAATGSQDQVAASLHGVITRLNRAIGEIRSFLHGMHTGLLPATGFIKALEDLASSMGKSGSSLITLDVDESACALLSTGQQLDMLNIIREAVSNGTRHSKATSIVVSARRHGDSLSISITDNGAGFDTGLPRRGMGIQNMRARAERIGVGLTLLSDAQGTRIHMELPLA